MAEHSSGGGQIWNDLSFFWLSLQKPLRWKGQMVSSLLSRLYIYSPSVSICSNLPFWSWQESRKPKGAHCFIPSFAACLIACQICHSAQKPPHPNLTNTSLKAKQYFGKVPGCCIILLCVESVKYAYANMPCLLDESGLVIISANYRGNGTPLIDDTHNRGFPLRSDIIYF